MPAFTPKLKLVLGILHPDLSNKASVPDFMWYTMFLRKT